MNEQKTFEECFIQMQTFLKYSNCRQLCNKQIYKFDALICNGMKLPVIPS